MVAFNRNSLIPLTLHALRFTHYDFSMNPKA